MLADFSQILTTGPVKALGETGLILQSVGLFAQKPGDQYIIRIIKSFSKTAVDIASVYKKSQFYISIINHEAKVLLKQVSFM